ncbi:hypothetical protein ONZ43_g4855 [Nemania bipapillata]|uniref:Uncharacterized protein n=1 Tax=Nemania bipapillata TaxID=110536 RepID=A0ACC2IHE6_9PEZI|nr:hypothetical protein ONZ43_g4855 [Nemania bipapillata]
MLDAPLGRLSRVKVPYCFLLLSLIPLAQAQWSTKWPSRQLESFFPAWNENLREQLATVCSSELKTDRQSHKWAPYGTVECLLKTFPEYRKTEIAASSVVLGLLPSILSVLGPSITDLALLATRRPLLSLLLAVSSPAVNPQPHGKYASSIKKKLPLAQAPTGQNPNNRSLWKEIVVSLIEHAAAAGALLNVAILAYQLSILCVTSYTLTFPYQPAIWVALSIAIHFFSYLALRLRVARTARGKRRQGKGFLSSCATAFAAELTPCKYQQPKTLKWRKKGFRLKVGRGLTWLLNFGIVAHILFGTLALSGLLFISTADAIAVGARFFASTLVSQWIITYELAGLKETTFLKQSVTGP